MTSRNNLDALFADAEFPFEHPGRNFYDTPTQHDRVDDQYQPPLEPIPRKKTPSTTAPATAKAG